MSVLAVGGRLNVAPTRDDDETNNHQAHRRRGVARRAAGGRGAGSETSPSRDTVLRISSRIRTGPLVRAFVDGLRGLGWLEGQNMLLEWRYAEGKIDRYPALVADLMAVKVDVLVAFS